MSETKKIYEVIAKVFAEVSPLNKRKADKLNYGYKALEDILEELHELFAKYELFIVPTVLEEQTEIVALRDIPYLLSKVKVSYEIFANDGSSVSAVTSGIGLDNFDKGMTKALTYAYKSFLVQTFMITTNNETSQSTTTQSTSQTKVVLFTNMGTVIGKIKECKTNPELMSLYNQCSEEIKEKLKDEFSRRKEEINKQKNN